MSVPWIFTSDDCPIVYHYTSLEAARAIAETRSIRLSEHTAMNDASEFDYARERLLEIMRDRRVYMDLGARFAVLAAIEALSANTGMMIGSLTACCDDLGQWRSYADNGKGCVLGLDARFLEHDAGVAIRTVLYQESMVDRMLKAALSVVQNQWAEAPDDAETLLEFAQHVVADLFTIKHPCFADEREIRISRMLVREHDGFQDVGGNRTDGGKTPVLAVATRDGAFGPTRYVTLPLTRDDRTSGIVSVGFGPAISTDIADANNGFFEMRGASVWRSTLPYRV